MAMRNFSAYFTFPGCGSEIHAGKICDLQFATTSNPIRVENTTATSFTFRALPGHSEGANRVITFSFSYQQSDQQLHLGVWSRGPWTLTAQGSIDSGLARNSWVTFAGNLITAIRNGDYNNFSGPTPGELSDSANPAIVRNADGRLEAFVLSNGGTLFHSWQVTPGGGWSGWFILGDPSWKFWSGPAVGTNADGRLEVFVIGMDYTLYHAWQQCAGCGWSGWTGLGSPGHDLMYPAVARNADGRLEAFAIASQQDSAEGRLYDIWQTSAGGGWSGWNDLGGKLNSPPTVGLNRDGRLEVFALGTSKGLFHMAQGCAGCTWGGWNQIGSWQMQSDPVVASNADGRLEVFGLGLDSALIHVWQNSPGGGWSGFASLGGHLGSAPSVAMNADGRLEVFMLDSGNSLYHIWQMCVGCGWSGWDNLGGTIGSVPAVANNADGRLDGLVVGVDGVSYHIWQMNGGGWSGFSAQPNGPWSRFSAQPNALAAATTPVVAAYAGQFHVFARAAGTGHLVHAVCVACNGFDWRFEDLGGFITGRPSVTAYNGQLQVFADGADGGTLWHRWFDGAGWHDWQKIACCGANPATTVYNNDLQLFARDTGTAHLITAWCAACDGSDWHYGDLGGSITGRPDVSVYGGQLRVLADGWDGTTVFQRWYDNSSGWHDWQQIGSPADQPTGLAFGNRFHVIAHSTSTGHVVHAWCAACGGADWNFEDLGTSH